MEEKLKSWFEALVVSAPDYVLMLFVAHQRELSFLGLVLDEKETLT